MPWGKEKRNLLRSRELIVKIHRKHVDIYHACQTIHNLDARDLYYAGLLDCQTI